MRRGAGGQVSKGFTLIELVIVIVVLGILGAVAVPKMANFIGESRDQTTRGEMTDIKLAIVGDASARIGGVLTDQGFKENMGRWPASMSELVTDPGGGWNKFTQSGWNGPYVSVEALTDAWGTTYAIDTTNKQLISRGPDGVASGDDIIVSLQ